MLCWHSLSPSLTHLFLYSLNVSLPSLSIADMGEVSWKKVSVSVLPSSFPPSVLFNHCFLFTSLLSCSFHLFLHPVVSSFHVFFLISSIPQMLHTVNTLQDLICLAKCFLAAGWKACSTDSKSGAICYLIGWHGELSVDFSYRGEQGDNGTVSATSGAAGARRR